MSNYDWYLSPADRFQYETDFKKYTNHDTVTLKQLDPLFNQSRISTNDFIQIWQLIDIKYSQEINLQQFVYFMHVLVSKRRGFPIPFSLPLNIKEEFLKTEAKEDKIYKRVYTSDRDLGMSVHKSYEELELELKQLHETIGAAVKEKTLLEEKVKESKVNVTEGNKLLSVSMYHDDDSEIKKKVDELQDIYDCLKNEFVLV